MFAKCKKYKWLEYTDVKVDIFDDKNDISIAQDIASKIVSKKIYDLVIGHYFSSTSNAAGKIYQKKIKYRLLQHLQPMSH